MLATSKGWINKYFSKLGIGQTWQDMSASRVGGAVNYTNNTGKAIAISVNIGDNYNSGMNVDGVTVANVTSNAGMSHNLSAVVPNGSVYNVTTVGVTSWYELT